MIMGAEVRDEVMAEVMEFMKSRVILTATELDLFTKIDERPAGAQDIAAAGGLDPEATRRILDALSALGFLDKSGEIYQPTERGRLLSALHPKTIRPTVLHFNHLWETWSGLTSVTQEGREAGRKPTTGMDEEARKAFIGAMHVIGHDLSVRIAEAFTASRFSRLLDIGGASGTYTIAFLKRNPTMKAVLFDLAPVIPMAQERLRREGLAARVELVTGNFYTDELPAGCDLALLSAIIHQNSTEENIGLYRKIHRALLPGGSVLIRDHVMDESRTKPVLGALFSINMLVNTSGGGTYTFDEIKDSLEKAGFERVRWLRKGHDMDSLVEAEKPI
jgi:hypothetical protein